MFCKAVQAQGRNAKALKMFEEVLEIMVRCFGTGHAWEGPRALSSVSRQVKERIFVVALLQEDISDVDLRAGKIHMLWPALKDVHSPCGCHLHQPHPSTCPNKHLAVPLWSKSHHLWKHLAGIKPATIHSLTESLTTLLSMSLNYPRESMPHIRLLTDWIQVITDYKCSPIR